MNPGFFCLNGCTNPVFAAAVKRKHAEYVPDRLSEQEFWTSFFQSHYFHRDRINSNSKDLFAECAVLDEHGKIFTVLVDVSNDYPLVKVCNAIILSYIEHGELITRFKQLSTSSVTNMWITIANGPALAVVFVIT